MHWTCVLYAYVLRLLFEDFIMFVYVAIDITRSHTSASHVHTFTITCSPL